MTKSRKKSDPKKASADTAAAVDAFMTALKHPHKPAIEALRKIIRGADSSIAEGVKWKAPSFRTAEYFATTHLRAKSGVGVILHLGAKVRAAPAVAIKDPKKLLTWLGKDRATVTFAGLDELKAQAAPLHDIVRQWIKHV